jgi:hypothetical protein
MAPLADAKRIGIDNKVRSDLQFARRPDAVQANNAVKFTPEDASIWPHARAMRLGALWGGEYRGGPPR